MTPAAFRAAAANAVHTRNRAMFEEAFQALIDPDYRCMSPRHLAERRNYLQQQLATCNEQIERIQAVELGRRRAGYEAEDAREAVARDRAFDTRVLRQYLQTGFRPITPR